MSRPTYSIGRREFLGLAVAGGTVAVTGVGSGCATNPVTGSRQLMLMSEFQEIAQDRQYAPHQFSADYGQVDDPQLNAYVTEVGMSMARASHRPRMPYSFRALNAVIANAYTFPGGSVAIARGLLVSLENEAQLAGVLGHEVGHVAARHAAEHMTKGILTQAAVVGVTLYVEHEEEKYADLAYGLGAFASGALLAHYSRDDEREADSLGMQYMARAGYNPEGMVQLMQILMAMGESEPSSVDMLFSTHPLTRERYMRAKGHCAVLYKDECQRDLHRERFMDRTASLRRMAPAIKEFEKGQMLLMEGKPGEAEPHLRAGLQREPDDYAGLMIMSKCMAAQKRMVDAESYARQAKRVLPGEPQADFMLGMAAMGQGNQGKALAYLGQYDKALPGNPETAFLRGRCYERLGQRGRAAEQYQRYLQLAPNGANTGYAQRRLNVWLGRGQ